MEKCACCGKAVEKGTRFEIDAPDDTVIEVTLCEECNREIYKNPYCINVCLKCKTVTLVESEELDIIVMKIIEICRMCTLDLLNDTSVH